MPQSLSQVWLHIVFSTKERRPYLKDPSFRNEMFPMLSHHVQQFGCYPKLSGGWIDHVHVLCGLSRTKAIASLLEEIKTETSKWAKTKANCSSQFSWQTGYGVFSVSQSKLESVIDYIRNQDKHHQHISFQDEFRELCRLHEVAFDERYAWD